MSNRKRKLKPMPKRAAKPMRVEGRGNIDWQKLAALEEGEAIIRLAFACNDLSLAASMLKIMEREFDDKALYLGSAFYVMRLMLSQAHETKLLIEEVKSNPLYGKRISKIVDESSDASGCWEQLKYLKEGNLMELTRNKGLSHYKNNDQKRAEKKKEALLSEWTNDSLQAVSKLKPNPYEISIYGEGRRLHFADRVMRHMFEEKIAKTNDQEKISKDAGKILWNAWTVADIIVTHYLKIISTTQNEI